MAPTLILEAFGQLTPGTAVIVAEEEDLYSVFRARAELMSWCTTSAHPRPLLWGMEEAELTDRSASSRIGWVQVGLEGEFIVAGSEAWPGTVTGFTSLPTHRRYTVDPAAALPALSQCFEDALRRFGDFTLSGLQVTIRNLEPSSRASAGDLNSALNWFNLAPPARAEAHIAFDHGLIGGHIAALVARLRQRNTGSFTFGPVVDVPAPHLIHLPAAPEHFSPALVPADLGVAVTLPEWTASAAGWSLGLIIDTARALMPAGYRRCAVRVTRVR